MASYDCTVRITYIILYTIDCWQSLTPIGVNTGMEGSPVMGASMDPQIKSNQTAGSTPPS